MAGLLWYFPGELSGGDARPWFAAAGLKDLVRADDDAPCALDGPILCGPDGGVGRLAFWETPERPRSTPKLLIDRERQTWLAAPPCGELPAGRFWVGFHHEARPTPEDLQRRKMLPGAALDMGGQSWIVPTARQLPRRFAFDAAGRPEWVLKHAEHERFHDEARRLIAQILADRQVTGRIAYDLDEHLTFAARALTWNYRVSLEVLALLELIDDQNVWFAAYAAAGIPLDDEDEKKSAVSTGVGG